MLALLGKTSFSTDGWKEREARAGMLSPPSAQKHEVGRVIYDLLVLLLVLPPLSPALPGPESVEGLTRCGRETYT